MSKASNLAGFVTSILPINNLNVGVITASSFVGDLTGTASTATSAGTAYGLTGSPDVTVGIITATVISAGSTTGTDGQVLQSTGAGVTWTDAASGGISVNDSNVIGYNSAGIRSDSANGRLEVFGTGNFQVFTSPGTFVVNPGISSIRVRVVGAGGAGAAGLFVPTTTVLGGGGGGGGGYAHKVVTSFTAPRSYAVTVGTSPGGTSSFGSEVSATGGSSAPVTPPSPPTPSAGGPAGAGGTGSGGDVNFTGATGEDGYGGNTPERNRGGKGGAAATQKGNGSGSSVPGLPSDSTSFFYDDSANLRMTFSYFKSNSISRFPFDIFNGYSAIDPSGGSNAEIPVYVLNGWNGGSGGNAYGPPGGDNPGGTGGYAGGGGAGYGAQPQTYVPGGNGGAGGIGAGGGGGGGGGGGPASPVTSGNGGSGGAGIVIVEW